MIKLSLFRNKNLVIALSSLFFLFSCSNHGLETGDLELRTINHEVFNGFKSNIGIINNYNQQEKSNQSIEEISQAVLDQVNFEMGTNLVYSNEALKLPDHTPEEIIEISLSNGWIDQIDVNLINTFIDDLKNHDFNHAITNYENTILSLSVSNDKFEKLNFTANLIRSANYQNPELFYQIQKSEDIGGFWDCALATLALSAATAGLASCATGPACALAVALHYNALKNFGRACLSEDKPEITNTQNN